MSKQINVEELKTLIANEIRSENLHKSLPEDAIEKIKEKILTIRDKNSIEDIPPVVSEELDALGPNLNGDDRKFPDERELAKSPAQQIDMTGNTTPFVHVDAGAVPINTKTEPTMGYSPELPDMLKKSSPSEVFVFQYNDITENGENLSYKPMRLMNDPDVKKSMNDLWIQEGKTKADVYVAKFEKIGEINFNYADGTSKFIEKSSLPDYAEEKHYKDNPYEAESTPQIDEPTKNDLETYVKNSIDLEKVVHDIVMRIVKDSLLTNTENAVNDNSKEQNDYIKEDIYDSEDNRENNGYNVAQSIKPMEETFMLNMKEIAEGNKYSKIILPKELNESIKCGDKSFLVTENESMRKWKFKNITYYTPINRISKNKGYIKS